MGPRAVGAAMMTMAQLMDDDHHVDGSGPKISRSAVSADLEGRYCYECTGFQCLHNPQDPTLFPGRVKCHPVMDYCTTHVRYTPTNKSLVRNVSLSLVDYSVTSATRACAKTWLGNTCRRDWLGRPEITCVTTCATDFCNCDSRSPPPEMFHTGHVLHLAPNHSTYSPRDMLSCLHMAGVPGFVSGGATRIDDDYNYYNDYNQQQQFSGRSKQNKQRRRPSSRRRYNSASDICRMTLNHILVTVVQLNVVVVILQVTS